MKTLDMRGSPCPLPVVNAKKELQEADAVIVLVDNAVAVQNLQKMADGKGYAFSCVQQDKNNFTITIERQDGAALTAPESDQSAHDQRASPQNESELSPVPLSGKSAVEGTVILIGADRMGRGCKADQGGKADHDSDELGRILIKGFIFSLSELPVVPKAVIFINSGVRLAVEGSNALADLQKLFDRGAKILACGTCLNYYALTEKLAVGEITNMMDITGLLTSAAKLVTL